MRCRNRNLKTYCTQGDNDNFICEVDPYVKSGDLASGLLPFIFAEIPTNGGRRSPHPGLQLPALPDG